MTTKFELTEAQQERMDAWSKHHWGVVHQGFRPHAGNDGFAGFFMFGPTGVGCNVKYECAWCNANSPHRTVDLTEDEDGSFIYQYDENWNRLPASWEKKSPT